MSEKIDVILSAFLADYSSKLHVRQIARMVNMNRQTVSETLKKLESSRIMDSQIEGRNKLYFINSSNTKAKIFIERAENKRKLEIFEKNPFMPRLVDHVSASSTAVLFGSYAKGIARKGSDIDLLVINGKSNFGTFEKEMNKEVQVFKMNEKQFLERLTKKDHLVVEVVKDHICLKNAERFIDLMWRANYG